MIRAELPGVDPDRDIDVSVDNGVLTIAAERQESNREQLEKGYRSEFRYGSFVRQVRLPAGTSAEVVSAAYKDGVLEIRMPKPTQEAASVVSRSDAANRRQLVKTCGTAVFPFARLRCGDGGPDPSSPGVDSAHRRWRPAWEFLLCHAQRGSASILHHRRVRLPLSLGSSFPTASAGESPHRPIRLKVQSPPTGGVARSGTHSVSAKGRSLTAALERWPATTITGGNPILT